MLGQIRRHQKWLWVVIAGATIISFVIFIDPTTGRRGRGIAGGRSGELATINGRTISAEEIEQARSEARLEYLFSSGRWPGDSAGGRGGVSSGKRAAFDRGGPFFCLELSGRRRGDPGGAGAVLHQQHGALPHPGSGPGELRQVRGDELSGRSGPATGPDNQ